VTVAIALFTRDLRVHDNPVLHAAATSAAQVIPLFVLDKGISVCPNRARFLAECLRDLDAALRELGSGLVLRKGDPVEEVAKLVKQHDVRIVHVAKDVSGYAQRRERALAELDTDLRVHDDAITIVAPGTVTPQNSDYFSVFSPYHRRWAEVPTRTPLRRPTKLDTPDVRSDKLPAVTAGAPDQLEGGEVAARAVLRAWDSEAYEDGHDDLAGDKTSHLSAHLHFGSISPTELAGTIGTGTAAARAFVRQLAWRDFNHQLLAARPEIAREDFRSNGVTWRDAEDDLEKWQAGATGFPIVDAGMRQLLREGWMHNRARLIVGSFLTKTLLIDWRLGARHFMHHLIDGDVANNQLNWQWVAGTGTDTRPGRVLNPLRQAERYDPDGEYVRRYVPELADLDAPLIHKPWTAHANLDYPDPMVELGAGRERYQSARKSGAGQQSLF
jgi:deoxyribodipyrimidine photo-lyase